MASMISTILNDVEKKMQGSEQSENPTLYILGVNDTFGETLQKNRSYSLSVKAAAYSNAFGPPSALLPF